jgi:hypothetical protein
LLNLLSILVISFSQQPIAGDRDFERSHGTGWLDRLAGQRHCYGCANIFFAGDRNLAVMRFNAALDYG